nr:helicase-related protein [Suttonella ornithocola]
MTLIAIVNFEKRLVPNLVGGCSLEYFKEQGNIMIATEAAAEGINLQFCSLVINYDLPWNPQRVEQRIGRCHRYGQTHDVVVVNFIDKSNEADQRVYELLAEKFQLFNGVFGTSDEVLGAISSGVDIERRIAAIYRNCREPDAIKTAFAQLQNELAQEINTAINHTRQQILENFDESVQEKLKLNKENSDRTRSQYEQMLMQLTQSLLKDHADFDNTGFILKRLPENIHGDISLGRYELPRRSGNSHLYRIQHPLAQQLIAQAKNSQCPEGRLTFNYHAYGNTISTLFWQKRTTHRRITHRYRTQANRRTSAYQRDDRRWRNATRRRPRKTVAIASTIPSNKYPPI